MSALTVLPLALLHVLPAAFASYHILLYKRDVRAASSWLMVCLLVPYAGPIAYYFLGINRVRVGARSRGRGVFNVAHESTRSLPLHEAAAGKGLAGVGARITGQSCSGGNAVEVLHNGDEAYPAMLAGIDAAREQICFATYILRADAMGQRFIDALVRAESRGVRVLVLLDGVGELYARGRPRSLLRRAGVNAVSFLPPGLRFPGFSLNCRNHRKLLTCDHEVAFVGGINIAEDNCEHGRHPREISDVHFRLTGPVAREIQAVFARDWQFATGRPPPPMPIAFAQAPGACECRVVADGPDESIDSLALLILAAIGAARSSIQIMTPYFLPNRQMVAALQAATLRGVRVQVVLPASNNLPIVHWANRNVLTELTAWGVRVYYQPAPFAHSKLLCVDDDYSLIGSANLDPRSLRLNFEIAVEVFSRSLSERLRRHIEETIRRSEAPAHEPLSARPVPVRLRDSLAALLSPYL
ncbi:MAG: phospholipase D-like domain-containing protein [Pseudomonadota bacterium]